MSKIDYPTGWGGKPETQDELSSNILLVVTAAGKTISYKDAIKQIEEIMKSDLGKKR